MQAKLREIIIEYSNLTNPDGSAIVCQGNTIVQSSVYGPSEIQSSKECSSGATLFVSFKPKISKSKDENLIKSLENYLQTTIETIFYGSLHPRTSVSLIIQEVQDDGSLLSTAINSACCALLDAGFPMRCLIASVTAIINVDGHIVVDPNLEASENSLAKFVFSFDSVSENLISFTSDGSFTMQKLKEVIKLCKLASKSILDVYKQSVSRRFGLN